MVQKRITVDDDGTRKLLIGGHGRWLEPLFKFPLSERENCSRLAAPTAVLEI